ncbi:hypothetical protein BDF20DRAFT_880618, partial [Mycotypha africana]|uniref:uncharacterized protein n=1 Tax=Mycotypha africana TaxID=64632 RepID=UPI0022FFD25B
MYMKNSLSEDVEPCLRFGPNSRLSPKKLVDAILMNACFIEKTPYGFSKEQAKKAVETPLRNSATKHMLWEYLSTGSLTSSSSTASISSNNNGAHHQPSIECQACGYMTENDLPYRFRISILDDWACIDRYCRDRLVSVCEFYTFIRNIRQGYYNGRTLSDLFQESTRLKLQMFYARMGTLSQTLRQMGLEGDSVGQASAPNMVIPPPVIVVDGQTTAPSSPPTTAASSTRSSNDLHITEKEKGDKEDSLSIISKHSNASNASSVHPTNSVWL